MMFQFNSSICLVVSLFLCAQSQCIDKDNSEHDVASPNVEHEKASEGRRSNEKDIYDDILTLGSESKKNNIDASENDRNSESAISGTHGVRGSQKVHVTPNVPAPSYSKLVPIKGWDRYSGDSAKTVKQWGRWWQYLRMKEPAVMSWLDGLVIRIYPGNEVFRALFVGGIYDPNIVVIINSLLSKGSVFIDVGANIGYFSLLASKAVGKDGYIVAVEPSSRDYSRLVDNVKINNLTNIIATQCLAISNVSGSAKLAIACEERSALNTLGSEFSFKGIDKVKTEDVKMISIDELVSDMKLNRVDVLKLDIEGSELKALIGAKNVIEKFRPAIMLGVNENSLKACGTDHKEIQQILKKMRYRAYRVVDYPTFSLELIPDLEKEHAKIIFCLHESVIPPTLPQPEDKSIIGCVEDFFLR